MRGIKSEANEFGSFALFVVNKTLHHC
jgi:hypothetical protein